MTVVRLVVVACCALSFWRLVWKRFEPTTFVAFCMGLFFLFTKVFHNNYIVWWLPAVGVVLVRALSSQREASHPATGPEASSTPAA